MIAMLVMFMLFGGFFSVATVALANGEYSEAAGYGSAAGVFAVCWLVAAVRAVL